MSNPRNGPPIEVEGQTPHHRSQPSTRLSSHNATPTTDDSTGSGVPSQLQRRRAASWRLPALDPGRRSDPWHYEPPINGYEDAAHHLLSLGLLPAPNREGLQAIWLRGGHHRQAAEVIAQRWELTA